ncbi:alpha/beta hydrolase [Rhodococcus sp. NPDC057135]|uniref:alpha/beta hydrolase n=1 Tax=Rhodococcus sp. NPDC057135 TaxID=3346028 RepID=UPI003644DF6F
MRCYAAFSHVDSKPGGLGGERSTASGRRSDSGQKALEKAGIFGSTSVATWYGYDAPQTIRQAGLDGYADGGAGSLGRFQDGLRASHDGTHSCNTVIGHICGSTVIGAAASDGRSMDANDLFFVGSPRTCRWQCVRHCRGQRSGSDDR